MYQRNWSKENIKTVTRSPIIAKSVIQRSNRYEIIVVFQKSTRQEFYWIFQAKSPRTPQRAWKQVGYAARDMAFQDGYRQDFSSFVQARARTYGAKILSTRVFQKRMLAHLAAKTEHESIYADWSARDETKMTMDLVRRRSINSRKGRMAVIFS